jgi:hypothetical protein
MVTKPRWILLMRHAEKSADPADPVPKLVPCLDGSAVFFESLADEVKTLRCSGRRSQIAHLDVNENIDIQKAYNLRSH